MRTCLNSRAARPCIDSWVVFVIADSLGGHDSAFANIAWARAPILGSLPRWHGELAVSTMTLRLRSASMLSRKQCATKKRRPRDVWPFWFVGFVLLQYLFKQKL